MLPVCVFVCLCVHKLQRNTLFIWPVVPLHRLMLLLVTQVLSRLYVVVDAAK